MTKNREFFKNFQEFPKKIVHTFRQTNITVPPLFWIGNIAYAVEISESIYFGSVKTLVFVIVLTLGYGSTKGVGPAFRETLGKRSTQFTFLIRTLRFR